MSRVFGCVAWVWEGMYHRGTEVTEEEGKEGGRGLGSIDYALDTIFEKSFVKVD